MNIADVLLAQGVDDRPALLSPTQQFTYAELRAAGAQIAARLVANGIQPGDRVGLLGGNSLFWVAAYLAILKLEAVAVPFATTLAPAEVGEMQRFVGLHAVCADRPSWRRYAAVFPEELPVLFDSVLTEASGPAGWPSRKAAGSTSPDQLAALMFTSGTTARPRAVRITHGNIQANTRSIIAYLQLTAEDRIMAVLPFYYCFGTSLLHTHLAVGGSVVMGGSFVYPETVLDQMEATQCTGFAGVPSTYQTLLRNSSFPTRPWPHLRKLQQAGGKLQTVLIQELVQAVPAAQVFVMYGQTEATARLSYLPPDLLDSKLGSIGQGIPGVTLLVLGEAGQPVKTGEVGEIYAWGENISPGYEQEPEATAEKFVSLSLGQGLAPTHALRTGDLATVDEDGYIFVVDRKADFIKSYGFRVSSQQVEAAIVELPEVVAAAVIGKPDLVRGEAIQAFVVVRSGAALTAEAVISHCAGRLARHMIPAEVIFVPNLPTNAHGKIVKNELRKLAPQPS